MAIERVKLNDEQIHEHLRLILDWHVADGKLTKTFKFPSYAGGVLFAVAVAHHADQMDHHPDITIEYQKVAIAVNTHDVGGISPLDFELARAIDGLAVE